MFTNSMMKIFVTGNYDGGNPHNDHAIEQINDSSFKIFPEIEDHNMGYKFRLDVRIENTYETSEQINIILDWKDPLYSKYRDVIYIKENEYDWKYIKAKAYDETVEFTIRVPKGISYIALSPTYNYAKYRDFVDSVQESKYFSKELVYTTDEGRHVFCLRSKSTQTNSKRIFITARTHPYESAGSYNVEGIVEAIVNGVNRDIIERYEIFVIPMVCPDGVYSGMCRLNRIGAPDLAREIDENDGLSSAYIKLLKDIRPNAYLEFHNWMLKEHDGIFYLPWWSTVKVISKIKKQMEKEKRKKWIRGVDRIFMQRQPGGLKKYAQDNFKTNSMTIEYSWLGRTTQDMRTFGLQALRAILPIA